MYTRITPKKVEFDEDGYKHLVDQIEKLEASYNSLVKLTQNIMSSFNVEEKVLKALKESDCDIVIWKDESLDKKPNLGFRPKYMGQ
jgi:hypothetical protein|tara:strand:+ start:59 stop:316 length:258 start_codon:yes stop_codon:yes gene_type:complete